MPDVSVVMPVYNAELYFSKTIDFVLNQSLKNIEIIIVDDNSSDNTYRVICHYASADNRIKVIKNDKNIGAGASRNKGLKIATGDYIIFLDDDDFIENDMLNKLLNTASNEKTDVVICSSQFSNWHTKKITHTPWTIRDDLLPNIPVFSGSDIEYDIFNAFVWWPWDKFYSRFFLITNNLSFQEIRSSNDLCFTASSVLLAKRIKILPEVLIQHSVSRENSLENTRDISWSCAIDALSELKTFLEKEHLYSRREKDFKNYTLSFLKWNIDTISGEAYFQLYSAAKNFISVCNIKNSDIYNDEMIAFFYDIMNISGIEFLFKSRNDLQKNNRHE